MAATPGAGQLDKRVRFERRGEVPDGAGGVGDDWAIVTGPVAARIRPIRGNEEVLAHRLTGVVIFEITVRSSIETRQVKPEDRIVNQRTDEVYNIRAIVNPDERNRYLAMTCEGGVAT